MPVRVRHRVLAGLLGALLGLAQTSGAAENRPARGGRGLGGMIAALEVERQPRKPDWASPKGKPLFTFAWISDLHLSPTRFKLARRALRYIDRTLQPHFVIITGDNNSHAPKLEHQGKMPPVSVRRHLFFKQFLRENLKAPYAVIPGDNWPEDFEKVFGPFQFSFDYGGLHFLFTAPDRYARGGEGRAVFDDATWHWMKDDLARNRDRPTVFAMHETLLPPSFLDAGKAREMLEAEPSVIASFCGHLHGDVEFECQGIKYLVCPSLGKHRARGMKFVKVYPHALIIETAEYDAAGGKYAKVDKWQKIDVPASLRAALHSPPGAGFEMRNRREVPAHPRRQDPSLARRSPELVPQLLWFTGQFLTRRLRPRPEANADAALEQSAASRPATRRAPGD